MYIYITTSAEKKKKKKNKTKQPLASALCARRSTHRSGNHIPGAESVAQSVAWCVCAQQRQRGKTPKIQTRTQTYAYSNSVLAYLQTFASPGNYARFAMPPLANCLKVNRFPSKWALTECPPSNSSATLFSQITSKQLLPTLLTLSRKWSIVVHQQIEES